MKAKDSTAPPPGIVGRLRLLLMCSIVACGPVQYYIDESLTNLTCAVTAIIVSVVTLSYCLAVRRFRRAPLSCLMLLGFNVSAFSGALLIQTLDLRSLVYNLSSALSTFTALAITQFLTIAVHWVYLNSKLMLGLRFWLTRKLAEPLGLLQAPTNIQLWLFGLVGCAATVLSARNYTSSVEYGNFSEKFALGFIPFAVAPFFIPARSFLIGGEARSGRSGGNWIVLVGYALLLIAVAMANNARATFSSGFLTLALCFIVAVYSGNLVVTRRTLMTGFLLGGVSLPLFIALSDLSTAMVIARDERSNVSSLELIEITLSNFRDRALIEDRRRRDAAILGGDYNENYIDNPILARFVYTKFTDVNMTNALSLSDDQAAAVRKSAWSRILTMFPTPILNYLKIDIDKGDITFSSGDVYSFIARGLELGGYTTGSEVPDGLTIFGILFWPILAILVIIQFIVYDSLSFLDQFGKLRVSAVALLNVVPLFTVGIMQESVANQVIAIVRGIPQLVVLYLVITVLTAWVSRTLAGRLAKRNRMASRARVNLPLRLPPRWSA
jgi:hypothetical protein